MKRPIIFRGQSKENGEWVFGALATMMRCDEATCIMPNSYFATRDFGGEDENGKPIIEDEFAIGGFIPVNPETVGMFTGLNAVNKKKNVGEGIFEDDVFRAKDPSDDAEHEYLVVMWIPQRAAFYMVNVAHYYVLKENDCSNEKEFDWLFQDPMLYDFSIDCELTKVGNIHDNPEYLK